MNHGFIPDGSEQRDEKRKFRKWKEETDRTANQMSPERKKALAVKKTTQAEEDYMTACRSHGEVPRLGTPG